MKITQTLIQTDKGSRLEKTAIQGKRRGLIHSALVVLVMACGVTTSWSQPPPTTVYVPVTPEQDGFFPPLPNGPAPTPAPVTISLPTVTLDTSSPICTAFPRFVTTTQIQTAYNFIGFQANLTFDERVVAFDPATPVQPAGLTGSTSATWTVIGNVLPGGGPSSRNLRVLGIVNNTTTALVGTGNLFQLNMIRVGCNPPASSALTWAPAPDDFQFIDNDGNTPSPTQLNGVVNITGTPNCPVLDHFKAYRTTGLPVDPTDGNDQVQLRDQFDPPGPVQPKTVTTPDFFVLPVQKTHNAVITPITNEDTHLEMYTLTPPETGTTRFVQVSNQFGNQTLQVQDPVYLGVPTEKVEVDTVATGLCPPHDVDHFKFYRVTAGAPLLVTVDLLDQFHAEPSVQVLQPHYFGNPVEKTHNGFVTTITHPNDHLVCYDIVGASAGLPTDVTAHNQFDLDSTGPQALAIQPAELLCVPSLKLGVTTPTPTPGGPTGTPTPIPTATSTPTPTPIPTPTPTPGPTGTPAPTPTGTPTPGTTPLPSITVFPTAIQFTGIAGGAFPAPQSIQITTSNGAAWHSLDTSPWFDAHPTSGASGVSTTLIPHTNGLIADTYTQNITFSATGLPDKVVVVTLILTQPPGPTPIPLITVFPTAIEFTGIAGGALPVPQSIRVTTSNGAAWHSSDTSPWFDAHPTSGASGTSTTLIPHTNGLVAATYTQNITFSATGLPDKVVVVTLVVTGTPEPTPIPLITVFPTAIEFTGIAGGAFPAPQSIQITTSNGTAWHSSDTSPWFDAHPSGGASGFSTTLIPHTAGLVAGTYTENITFSATGLPSKVVVVTLVVTPTGTPAPTPIPLITVFPTAIAFTGIAGGPFPAPQSIQITTSNGTAWHSSDTSPWFDAHPTSGASGVSTTLIPHTDGLAAGPYTQNITFSATGLPSRIVVVSLLVTPTGTATPSPTATPTPPILVAMVSLPIATIDTSATNFTQPVVTSTINAADNLIGFQGDFTFDETVVTFDLDTPVQGAGLTATGWTVVGNIRPGGGPTSRVLRVLAYVNNGITALSGSGTLYQLNMIKVSSTPGASTALTWAPFPDDFEFIDFNLVTHTPGSTPPGSVTIDADLNTQQPTNAAPGRVTQAGASQEKPADTN